MLALIMAGGEGSRLGLGEKPLVTIGGIPMIRHVIDAFREAGHEPVVVASPRTPMTLNWCRVQGITLFSAEGRGYIPDLVEAVTDLEETGPLFTSTSDLPCLTADLIRTIESAYRSAGTPALSVWVPLDLYPGNAECREYTEVVDGVPACPAGINILLGSVITAPQEETPLLLRNRRLAYHVNTRKELEQVRAADSSRNRPGLS
ncbi:MAG: NTP transferase domain-containing protein [Methanomicrobiales archaeon]|nr:NTP transferase domain-containing protein [Methanomicrobiales archaeon]